MIVWTSNIYMENGMENGYWFDVGGGKEKFSVAWYTMLLLYSTMNKKRVWGSALIPKIIYEQVGDHRNNDCLRNQMI